MLQTNPLYVLYRPYMPLQTNVSPLIDNEAISNVNTWEVCKCHRALQERRTKTPQHEVSTNITQDTVELRTPHLWGKIYFDPLKYFAWSSIYAATN